MKKRIVTFKNPNNTLHCGGQVIHAGNITPEKFDELVAIAPSHADLFNVEEVKEEAEKKTEETAETAE